MPGRLDWRQLVLTLVVPTKSELFKAARGVLSLETRYGQSLTRLSGLD